MNRTILTDEPWRTIWSFLVAHPRVYVGSPDTCRRLLKAVRWVLRRGAPWRLLPTEWGPWNRVFKRFSRWGEHGVWAGWHRPGAHNPDLPEVFLDRTLVRAHAGAVGQQLAPRWRKPWDVPAVVSAPTFTP